MAFEHVSKIFASATANAGPGACDTAAYSSSAFSLLCVASFLLVPFLGRNFFPAVDTGQILMHVRTQVGTRVEETARQFAEIAESNYAKSFHRTNLKP